MKDSGHIGKQVSDLVVYLLLPWVCLLLPVGLGDSLIRRFAEQGWVLRARSLAACQTAGAMMYIADPPYWQARWREVELSEARDSWFCLMGRSKSLLARIRWEGEIPSLAAGHALLGLHWGPSVLALRAFQSRGLQPRFVHRRVDNSLRRQAPFQHLYLKMLVKVINRCCDDQAITVPGAKIALDEALATPCTPVLLMDAPPTRDRRVQKVSLLERSASIASDGIELLAGMGVSCTFFSLGLEQSGHGRVLSFTSANNATDSRELASQIGAYFNRHVLYDSAQWRLWHAADQLFDLNRTADG